MRSRAPWFLLAGLLALVVAPTAAADGPFATPSEVQNTLDRLSDDPWIDVEKVGESVRDRPIKVAVATDPTSDVPREEKVVTFILTQQHGNEPAGTPAALDLLERIHEREPVTHNLTNQVLVVLPQANPDGAAEGTRENVRGVDLNRDHVSLEEPESRAMHRVLNRWDPDIGMDHHEYGSFGPGNPVPVRTYDHDLLTLYPRHGNVEEPARAAAKTLMYDGIWPEAREDGYSAGEYGIVTADDRHLTRIAGGPDPGIQRNHVGLHHTASLLVESRIDFHPNPFHDAERRIAIHTSVMDATVSFAHENAGFLTSAKEEAEAQAKHHPEEHYEEDDPAGEIFEAYRIPEGTRVPGVAEAHGLTSPVEEGDGFTMTMETEMRGHAAALVHPDSSRAIVEGRPTEAPDEAASSAQDEAGDVTPQEAEAASSDGALDVPGPGAALATAAAGLAAAGAARRRD